MNHHCHAWNCKTVVPPKLFMCLKHWALLSKGLQSLVWANYKSGQEIRKDPTKEYLSATEMAIKFVKDKETARSGATARKGKLTKEESMNTLQIESKILVGAESKQWLADFTKQIDRLAKLQGSKVTATEDADEEETEVEEEDEDFAPKKKTKSKASFDEDEEEETEAEDEDDVEAGEDDAPVSKKTKGKKAAALDEDDEEEEAEEAPAKKSTKAKKLTTDDLNDACKARVARLVKKGSSGADARANVLKVLTKNFKVKSVSALTDQKDIAKAIELMGAK